MFYPRFLSGQRTTPASEVSPLFEGRVPSWAGVRAQVSASPLSALETLAGVLSSLCRPREDVSSEGMRGRIGVLLCISEGSVGDFVGGFVPPGYGSCFYRACTLFNSIYMSFCIQLLLEGNSMELIMFYNGYINKHIYFFK